MVAPFFQYLSSEKIDFSTSELVDAVVLFAKGDSPINFIKGTLRLVTAALMVVPTIKNLFAKNHKEKLSMVGDCFFMFSGW